MRKIDKSINPDENIGSFILWLERNQAMYFRAQCYETPVGLKKYAQKIYNDYC